MATPLPILESICGDTDERVKVDPEISPPYNWICSLVITDGTTGDQYYGSGFKIHIPDINCCIVMTCGHCVYDHEAYADNIMVTFPGQANKMRAAQADLYAPPEYINDSNADYDYGIIILPGNSDEGFGWSAIITDDELSGRIVTICGCPGDKLPWPQMFITGGEITRVTANRLFYMNDTAKGQSGSPVYTWYKGYWTVVGVHFHGNCPNSCNRVSSEMIYNLLDRTENLKKYALNSLEFPCLYIRCYGHGMTKTVPIGGGVINCQYGPPSDWETFYIYPVEVTPSLPYYYYQQTYIVVLKNCKWPNTFVRMDGWDITKYEKDGGGAVNCQWSGISPGPWESFVLEKDILTGFYSFQSVKFPHRYIRVDGSGVFAYKKEGVGIVNCQYYDNTEHKGPTSWEQFRMKRIY